MSGSRNALRILAGIGALGFAFLMLAFTALMYALETPLLMCVIIGATSLFPLLIAVACLIPSKRTIALRVIGGSICVGCIATLIMSFVAPPKDGEGSRNARLGTLVTVAIAGAAMAVKGKWPGADEPTEPTTPAAVA